MYFTDNDTELQHHGILGQKWGIRRFQNKDGTRTPAGKARERENDSQGERKSFNIDKSKVIKGAVVAGVVTAGAIALAHPKTREMLVKYGKTTISNLRDPEKTKALGAKIGKRVGKGAAAVQKAVINSILGSVGGIAISKINDKLKVDDNASEFDKATNKVVRDAAAAGIRAATGARGSGSNNDGPKKLEGGVKEQVKEKVGEPSNRGVDKQSPEWQGLFTDSSGNQRDKDTKDLIRSMAKEGYDIDQIDKYLNHSAINKLAKNLSFRW